ncbi:MAG: MiaB/RimO family radical SAM methylthiotransferase [Candidatus Moranbacteria bacterium]|nr:MiaB/RimO family radical SAM methylthiotransferase [Candidatus Moranbacteria bacterium]
MRTYFIETFGCQQNVADSERVASYYEARGYNEAKNEESADILAINTCVIRERAFEKVFGYIRNIYKKNPSTHIVITGCLIGASSREPSGKMMKSLKKRLPYVEFLPLEEVGFEYIPKRKEGIHAWLPISNGCNNFCTYCIVPFSRGRERSRPFQELLQEAYAIKKGGFSEITLLGQNVNSYGADFLLKTYQEGDIFFIDEKIKVKPVMVKHLGRHRIPTLFPHLLECVADMGFSKVSFMSSNPWDFSDELIDVIAKCKNIDRILHLPVQSGSDIILEKMNRWYTSKEYRTLIDRIRLKIPEMRFTTDIIVGFPGEAREYFNESLDLVRQVHFEKAYISCYSPRPGTKANDLLDDISYEEKKYRFHTLQKEIEKQTKNS